MSAIKAYNQETQAIMDTLNGKLSQKKIIQNYFGLRDEVVIAEDGKTILEVFDEFKDPEALVLKNVEWNDRLAQLGVQKEYFDTLLGKYLEYGKKISPQGNGTTDALT
jgi:hypothetical protein